MSHSAYTNRHRSPRISIEVGIAAAGVLLLLATTYAHIRVAGSEAQTGTLVFMDHVFDLCLGLGLLAVVLCVGHAVTRALNLKFANGLEHISFSIFLGTGFIGLSLLMLGLSGLLRWWSVTTLLVLTIVITGPYLTDLSQTIKFAILSAILTRERQVASLLFLCLIALLLLRALTPPSNGDELTYHLPGAQQFVDQGRVYASYDNALANIPFLIQMIYAACLIAKSDVAAKVFSLTLAINTAFAIYAFGRRFLTRRVATIALFIFFASGMVVEVAVTTRIDVTLAGMLFAATYAMIIFLETNQRTWLWVAAILAGFSLGIKHSAALWLLLVGAMYLIESLSRKRQTAAVLKYGLAYTCIAATIASPWYIKNYIWFHNPVYPFITGEAADFGPGGVRYFNRHDEDKLDAYFALARVQIPAVVKEQQGEIEKAIAERPKRHPMKIWEFFTKPESYLMSEPFHLPNYLFLSIPLIAFLAPNRRVLSLLLISFAFVLAVTANSWIARYLLTSYPSLSIVTAFVLSTLIDRFQRFSGLLSRLPIFAVAIALTLPLFFNVALMAHFNSFSYLAGKISRRQFLQSFPYRARTDFINDNLPMDSRVMLMGAQITYGLRRAYLTDESWFATKWRRLLIHNSSLEEVNQDLKRQQVSHILYCPRLFTFAAKMGVSGTGGTDLIAKNLNDSEEGRKLGPEYQFLRNWSTFTLYRSQYLEPIYSDDNGCELLRIK